MEDGTRSAPATGFQKFLLDPKSSVKTYLSEIQEKEKHNWQQNGGNPNQQGNWQQQQQQQYGNNGQQGYQGQGVNLNLPGSGYPDRPTSAAANHPFQPQQPPPHTPAPQQFGGPPPAGTFPLSPPTSHASFAPPPHAPTPVHPEQQLSAQFAQHTQQLPQHPQQTPAPQHDQPYGAPPSAYYPTEPNHAQNQSVSSVTMTSTSTEVTSASRSGLAPPGHEHHDAIVAAPKQYHRMIVEFETIKAVYFAAKIQPTHGDLVPVANKLKTLAHEIWNLRYTKSAEFTFPDAAHEQIITTWKAQFDLWTHVLEDLYDPVYAKSVETADAQEDWAKLAGLTSAVAAPVKAVAKKVTTKAKAVADVVEDEEIAAAAPVKKKVVRKVAAAVGGETETAKKTVVKKKVVKKVVAEE